jgi:hypothetical protein
VDSAHLGAAGSLEDMLLHSAKPGQAVSAKEQRLKELMAWSLPDSSTWSDGVHDPSPTIDALLWLHQDNITLSTWDPRFFHMLELQVGAPQFLWHG